MGIVAKKPAPDYEDPYAGSRFVLPPDTPETEIQDPELPYEFQDPATGSALDKPKSKLFLEEPANLSTKVEYDPKSGNYDVQQKMGERDHRPPTYLTPEEYQDYIYRKQMRDYWRSRVAADELNERPRQGLIPKLQVNSELFDRIFGGNTVDIKPTGTAELIFGLNRNKNLNPAIPQKQQKITNFDFNMRIQLNLIGKIGDKLKVTTNYNTEASFDWENQVKLDYTGYEDEIIKKIEAGNVTLPLNSSLISGSQTLFGFKTELQFGRLRATTVFSQQKGKKQEITVEGGAQTQQFNVPADNYEQNKHFFLGHYFRRNYDNWMNSLPIVNTPVVITKVEVYLLGINGNAEQTRNVIGFQDLGEQPGRDVWPGLTDGPTDTTKRIYDTSPLDIPFNRANSLYDIMVADGTGLLMTRQIDEASNVLSSATYSNVNNPGQIYMDASRDYNIIRNARRLNPSEFTFNPRLGYISLNQQLNNDQAIAVSYQYTYGDSTYQVGEFTEQVPDNTKLLVCKLLKSTVVNVKQPMWKLMMKNVYAIGAYNLNPQDFRLDVFYNNIETGVDIPYLPSGPVNGIQLIRVLGADSLSVNGDPVPDGMYDFINGYTISQNNGRVYFPTAEPFGSGLKRMFGPDTATAAKYVFQELYDSTRTAASFIQNKNRYKIKGSYRSASGSEIQLNALNIPEGAVVVTANGAVLQENVDYTVNYTLGRVTIINESLLNSQSTIKVSLESNSLFSVQQKSLLGTRLDYRVSRDLTLGSTFLRFSERPLTQKVSVGDEPVSNVVGGFDYSYKTDVPLLTRLLDKLPLYSTKEMSSITTRGEIAKLFPGNAKAIRENGGNSYIDDFEGSISLIDIRGAQNWYISSVPNDPEMFPEGGDGYSNTIKPGLNRARLQWYNVDAIFTRDQGQPTPQHFKTDKLFSNNMWRQVFETELFPGKTPPNGQQQVLGLLDLAFFPTVRGPYNYDVNPEPGISAGINFDGSLKNPETRWGGIMRRLETNDFQAANIEYIQFWLMDPYNKDYSSETDPAFNKDSLPEGDLYINIGNISEDVVKDGRMSYENGLPGVSEFSQNQNTDTTNVAIVPLLPPIINAFSQDPNDRPLQDVGYDGMNDEQERRHFADAVAAMQNGPFAEAAKTAFVSDPSSDRYHHFRGDDYDDQELNAVRRYALFNNPEGNTPTEAQYNTLNPEGGNYATVSNQPNPTIEDVNRDNTLSTSENYYQYRIRISPTEVSPENVGSNFIVDAFDSDPKAATFSGETKIVKWYQFKIPISQFEKAVGGIEGFNAIRFMRVFMKGFKRPVVLRMARFELVRSDWRRYQFDLREEGEYIAVDENSTSFDVSAVSLLENGGKLPVNYVLPPDIEQQQNVQATNLVLQNEQALQMRVCDLKDGDSRAIFRNVDYDTRMFENIKMNVHAENPTDFTLKDGDLRLFFRVGSDYNSNYYEYEVPLKLTPHGRYDSNDDSHRQAVWPADNEVNLKFSDISYVKTLRNGLTGYDNLEGMTEPYSHDFGGYTVTIVGNPNLATVKSIMVGVRNPRTPDKQAHCVEVWVNELRLTNFNNKGGWATTGQLQAKLADLGMVAVAGTYKSPFWGGVESKINERSREKNLNWDVSASMNAGKFFPTDWKITLPLYYNYGQTKITPLFNPLDPDVKYDDVIRNPEISDARKKFIEDEALDLTERKGFNISNARIDGLKRPNAKPMPWDISNFSATYAYSEFNHQNVNVEYNIRRQYRGNLQYTYTLRKPPTLKPFEKSSLFKNKWFAIIKDINLQLLPNTYGLSFSADRTYSALKNRDITSFYGAADVFDNPTLVNKNFTMLRSYNLRWDLTKSLKYDYTASNQSRILEPYGEYFNNVDKPYRDYVINTFMNGVDTTVGGRRINMGRFGENTNFRQEMNLNADLPINKIPILDFIKTTYRYGGSFTWLRRPFAAPDSVGNTIQNTSSHNITGNFNLVQLYNKIPYFRKLNNPSRGPQRPAPRGQGARAPAKDSVEKVNNFKEIAEFGARFLMMIKSLNVSYQRNGGQGLPNFKPSSQYGGMDFAEYKGAPGFLFTTGLYDPRIRQRSGENGWLEKNALQTVPYTETDQETYNYRSNIEPHGSLRIELNGTYNRQKSLTEYIVYNDIDGFRYHVSPMETGNFNISTITLLRSFRDGNDPVESNLFDEFLTDREDMAMELGKQKGGGLMTVGEVAFVDGYSLNQQDVLMGSFYRTYTGQKIDGYSTSNIFPKIPLPNWTVTWDGLGKLPLIKDKLRSITVRHGYRSSYAISGYNNNILYRENGGARMPVSVSSGPSQLPSNFVPRYSVNAVTLSERFEPLVRFDVGFKQSKWSANVEHRRDKTTSLNLTGFQIIETKGQEYIIGLGYLYPKLRIKGVNIQGRPLESDLQIKVDISFRKNVSVIRMIETGLSTPTGGSNILTMRSQASYLLTQNITLNLFYDWIRNTPQTSATFPTSNINAGFSLRINFQ